MTMVPAGIDRPREPASVASHARAPNGSSGLPRPCSAPLTVAMRSAHQRPAPDRGLSMVHGRSPHSTHCQRSGLRRVCPCRPRAGLRSAQRPGPDGQPRGGIITGHGQACATERAGKLHRDLAFRHDMGVIGGAHRARGGLDQVAENRTATRVVDPISACMIFVVVAIFSPATGPCTGAARWGKASPAPHRPPRSRAVSAPPANSG